MQQSTAQVAPVLALVVLQLGSVLGAIPAEQASDAPGDPPPVAPLPPMPVPVSPPTPLLPPVPAVVPEPPVPALELPPVAVLELPPVPDDDEPPPPAGLSEELEQPGMLSSAAIAASPATPRIERLRFVIRLPRCCL